jgi:hypothetical protein
MEKAKANGELPAIYRPKQSEKDMKLYDRIYTGHPYLEMEPLAYDGDVLHWTPGLYDWGMNCAENAADVTRAHLNIRRQIVALLSGCCVRPLL